MAEEIFEEMFDDTTLDKIEENTMKIGDLVEISETSPFSKKKSWELVKILETKTEV